MASFTNTNNPAFAAVLDKMKKRKTEENDNVQQERKRSASNIKVDVPAYIIHSRHSEKQERFEVMIAGNDYLKTIENDPRSNGYFDETDDLVKIKSSDSDDYDIQFTAGQRMTWTRYTGGKEDASKAKRWDFMTPVILRRCFVKTNAANPDRPYFNLSWVEIDTSDRPITIPKSVQKMDDDNYWKIVDIGNDEIEDVTVCELKITSNQKIYTRMQWTMGGKKYACAVWQETLLSFGIYNPEAIENTMRIFLKSGKIALLLAKPKDSDDEEQDSDRAINLNLRSIRFLDGDLKSFIENAGVETQKKGVTTLLGKTVSSVFSEGHPLNSIENTKMINLTEWSGKIADLPKTTKFYQLGDAMYACL